MDRNSIITKIRANLDALASRIEDDEELTDENRASLTETVDELRGRVDDDRIDETTDDELSVLAGLVGVNVSDTAASASTAGTAGTWADIRRIMADEMGLKNIMYSDPNDDDYVTAQFGMGDGEGRKLIVRVIYTPDAHCVQIRAGYPFDLDLRVLPIARKFICKRNYEMRYTRIEMDERDGEVYICTVIRSEDTENAPEGFETMLHLTMSVGFDEYDTLRRYSRAEFTDDERAELLEEVERISPLMLEK